MLTTILAVIGAVTAGLALTNSFLDLLLKVQELRAGSGKRQAPARRRTALRGGYHRPRTRRS